MPATTPLTLLERMRKPDDAAWTRLIAIYRPFVYRLLSLGGLKGPDLDDLLQDVMLVLVRHVPTFCHSGRPGSFRTWLRRIVTHRVLGYRREKAIRGRTGRQIDSIVARLGDPKDELTRLWDHEHDRHVIQRLLELLQPEFTESTWRAFLHQAMEGRIAKDVAEELGLSVNAVLVAKSRVLRRLRQEATGLIEEQALGPCGTTDFSAK